MKRVKYTQYMFLVFTFMYLNGELFVCELIKFVDFNKVQKSNYEVIICDINFSQNFTLAYELTHM